MLYKLAICLLIASSSAVSATRARALPSLYLLIQPA
jgi:hypothetical protein